MCSKKALKKLKVMQNKAIRIIDNATYNATTNPLFKKCGILNLQDMIGMELVKFAHSLSCTDLPESVCNLFKSNAQTHNYSLIIVNRFRILHDK